MQNAGFEPWQLFGLEENGRNDPSSPTVLAPRIRTAYYVRDIKHYCNIMHDTDHKMASVQTYKGQGEGVNLLNYTKKHYSPLILSFSLREKRLAFYYMESLQLFLKINFEIGSKKYIHVMKTK